MIARTFASIVPRQSPSFLIFSSISEEGGFILFATPDVAGGSRRNTRAPRSRRCPPPSPMPPGPRPEARELLRHLRQAQLRVDRESHLDAEERGDAPQIHDRMADRS